MQVSQHIVINISLDFEFTLNPFFFFRLTIFSHCYPCEVYQIKSHLNVAKCSTNRQYYVRGWKIWWNRQVYCCFVVTPPLQAVWVRPLLSILVSFTLLKSVWLFLPTEKKGVFANQDHVLFCDHTLITITYDYWGKQNVREVWVT